MLLEDYLQKLKDCSDERLEAEWAINDNFTIFFKKAFITFLQHFNDSENYQFKELSFEDYFRFDYVPGIITVQVFQGLAENKLTGYGLNRTEEERQHFEKQNRDYNTTIMLHPYQKKRIFGMENKRAIAMVVDDICRFSIDRNIPLCIPNIGTDFLKPYDFSRIVYFP